MWLIFLKPTLQKCESEMKVKVAQSCPTLCDPMDYTVHGILQARILERVAFPFCRGSSQSRDQTQVSHIAGRFFTSWNREVYFTRETEVYLWVIICIFARMHAVGSVVSDSVQPHRWQPTRLLCPWGSPGKHTGVGCHFLLLHAS